ncbi:hypothetical protein LTR66_013032 [Elasticomyces elasticus]|nr:hypothetical protein LTR66_013032 [Elasticomyces elasticus]
MPSSTGPACELLTGEELKKRGEDVEVVALFGMHLAAMLLREVVRLAQRLVRGYFAQSQRVSPFFVEWLIVSYADYGGTLEKTLWSLLLGLMLFIAVWKSRWEEGSQAGVSDVVVEARL